MGVNIGRGLKSKSPHQYIGVGDKPKLSSSKLEKSVPLAKYVTFGIGGNADYFCVVRSKEDLSALIKWCRYINIPFFTIGNGSNLLIKDEGFKGLAIKLGDCFKKVSRLNETLTVGAAVSLAALLKKAKEFSLGGLEPLAGIPGTVGGAIITNAGTSSGKMEDVVTGLKIMDFRGEKVILKEQIDFSYRRSGVEPKKEVILEVGFSLFKKSRKEIEKEMKKNISERKKHQPCLPAQKVCWQAGKMKSAGCIFKNPQEGPAAKFIEEAGLKGLAKGGAEVSRLHANFIVNTGNATSGDVLKLMRIIQNKVQKKFDIFLEPEIKIV